LERIDSIVEKAHDKMRLDRFLASIRPEVSRSEIQRHIRDGLVHVGGEPIRRAAHRVRAADAVSWRIPEVKVLSPAPIPLDILYEDDALVAIDKPVGLVVHPGAGTTHTTLVEGLLATRTLPASDDVARPGIVHRLDKETSGVIVVAKSELVLSSLQRQFAARTVSKSYLAVVEGLIEEDEGAIDAPVGRDPKRPSRMAILPAGRRALTEFRVLKREPERTLLWVRPKTGRTHQIRVHFKYIGHPVVGDAVYGRRATGRPGDSIDRTPGSADGSRPVAATPRTRMLLHAWRLVLRHPETGQELRIEAAPPSEFPTYPYETLPWSRIPDTP
jgi:23S rRNA pseudouridine1911/1915/1917 synthase